MSALEQRYLCIIEQVSQGREVNYRRNQAVNDLSFLRTTQHFERKLAEAEDDASKAEARTILDKARP
jgi:hypothetical protein